LLQSLREFKRDTILAPVTIACEVILEVTVPLLTAAIIDNGIEKGDMGYVLRTGGFLIVIVAFSLMFGALSGKYAASASAGLGKNLRKDMYYNVQDFSFSNIDRFSTASLITRMTTDVDYVQMAFQMVIRTAVRSPMMFIFGMGMAFYIEAKLAWIFLLASIVLGIGLYLIAVRAHPIFESVFRKYDSLNNVVQENVQGMRVVKSFVREEHEKSKFFSRSEDIYRGFVKAQKLLAANGSLVQFCMYTCVLLISWLGAKMIVSRTMTTGELMSIITYAIRILVSLMMLSMVFVMIVISRASAQRIYEVLEEKPDLHNPDQPVYDAADGSIEFDHVDFSYVGDQGRLCLNEVNFKIVSGQTVGVIGGTGSSKTSLINLIPRLYDVAAGAVRVGGIDVREYDLTSLRNQVAVVLQKNVLFSGTIKENLRWGNKDATDEEIIDACKLAQAHEFILSFPNGYDTRIEQGGSNVSGGQKQRLCIARALLKKPKILILDDSTSAVDTKTDALIRKAFREEIPNTTKIIIAQRIASVQDADVIIVLDEGRVSAIGTHEELLKTSVIYKEVYDSQVRGALKSE